MSTSYAVNIQEDSLTFIIFDPAHAKHLQQFSATKSELSPEVWEAVRKGLLDQSIDPDEVIRLIQPQKELLDNIERSNGNFMGIHVVNGQLFFNGNECLNSLADRILDMYTKGYDITSWVRCAEKVYRNPRPWMANELDLWLNTSDLPITPDGDILAYKKVRNDYLDIYTGTMDNSPGRIVSVPEEVVDTDRNRTCSSGLHFCSKEYLRSYGSSSGRDRVVIVKINPEHIVSIPSDYDNAKGRTWRYEVVGEIPAEEIQGKVWEPVAYEYGTPEPARIITPKRLRNIPGVGRWHELDDGRRISQYENEDYNEAVEVTMNVDGTFDITINSSYDYAAIDESGIFDEDTYRNYDRWLDNHFDLYAEDPDEALMTGYYMAQFDPERPALSADAFYFNRVILEDASPLFDYIDKNLRGVQVDRSSNFPCISRTGRSNRNLRWRLAVALVNFADRYEYGPLELNEMNGTRYYVFTDENDTTVAVTDDFQRVGYSFLHQHDVNNRRNGELLAVPRLLGLIPQPKISN